MAIFNKDDNVSKTSSTTIISKGTKVKGDLEVNNKLHIEGEIEGNIICKNNVSVGKGGKIKGELVAKELILNGELIGKVDADKIEIEKEGKLFGDILVKDFVIAAGGVFQGTSTLKTNKEIKK